MVSGVDYGKLTLHNMIVIDYDAIGTATESIYPKMFAGDKSTWIPRKIGVSLSKSVPNASTSSQLVFNVTTSMVRGSTVKQYNIPTQPTIFPYDGANSLKDYLNAGNFRYLW